MRRNLILAFAAIVACIHTHPAFAIPTTYVYDQTSSTVPGFHVTGSILIDGGFGDLPNLNNSGNPGPYDFGNLLGLSLSMDGRFYSLADYDAGCPLRQKRSPASLIWRAGGCASMMLVLGAEQSNAIYKRPLR